MPIEAAAGLFEALAALVGALAEALVLLASLIADLICLLVWLVAKLLGRKEKYRRPQWIDARREAARESDRQMLAFLIVIVGIALVISALHFGRTDIRFRQKGWSSPYAVEVILSKGSRTKTVYIGQDELQLLRGRWDRLTVTDSRYHPASHPIAGTEMELWLDKKTTPGEELRDAAVRKTVDLIGEKLLKHAAEQKP